MNVRKTIVKLVMLALVLLGADVVRAQQYVILGGVLDSTLVLPKLGGDSAYLVNESLRVESNGKLVVEAGSRIHFTQSASLRVDGGRLQMEGTKEDSIRLFCYELSHDWMGVQLKNVVEEDAVRIEHVEIMGALSALSATSCSNVSVRHCTFNNYYAGKGIELVDCSHFLIDSCSFYCVSGIGIGMMARSNDCSGNRISHCIFDQGQINVEVSNVGYSYKCHDNVIDGNCFQGAATAISFESVGGLSDKDAKNYILNNLISSDLPGGSGSYSSFGIKAAMDSLVIRNNVFWRNDEAVTMLRVCHLVFEHNTFYDNKFVLTNLLASGSACFSGNTISEAKRKIVSFPSGRSRMNGNNFLHCAADAVLFHNRSGETVDMRKNYWGTASADAIEAVIYDHDDDPSLGRIEYEGFLPSCDTTAPVSPPFMVKQQLVNDSWLVSWDENPEADVDHYVVFYGDFDYYKFAHHVDSIYGNTCVLTSQQADNVAVMACDRAYRPEVYAAVGQSAYAFATYYPYAGADGEMCAPQAGFQIRDANIPFTYNRFAWHSSGTGIFSDSLALHPTYYPSEDDFESGEVTLSLRVVSQGTVKTDDMRLVLFKELVVSAGEDYYSGLNRPIVLRQAVAANYDSIRWSTTGDGVFEDETALSTLYYPGNADRERRYVELTLTAWSPCGIKTDAVRFDLYEDYTLEGTTLCGGLPCAGVQVVAVGLVDGNPFLSGFYRTESDSSGRFRFEALLPDTYILYAFPDTVEMTHGAAYYLGDFQWNESNMIRVDGNVYDVDVVLPPLQQDMAVGSGAISGVFDYPSTPFNAGDFYCCPWLRDDEQRFCDGGLSNVGVLLLNGTKQRLMGFALTDAKGVFRFSSLPFGKYYVMADVPRYGRGVCVEVNLAPEQPLLADIHLFIDEGGKVSRRQPAVAQHHASGVFPNPAAEEITLAGLEGNAVYEIALSNPTGSLVLPKRTIRADALGEYVMPIGNLPDGLYVIAVRGNSDSFVVKFVKY